MFIVHNMMMSQNVLDMACSMQERDKDSDTTVLENIQPLWVSMLTTQEIS